MQMTLVMDHRFVRHRSGVIYSRTRYDAAFFETNYLPVFDSVKILARVEDDRQCGEPGLPIESARISVVPLPMWSGPVDAACKVRAIRNFLEDELGGGEATMLMAPGVTATLAAQVLERDRRVYGLEVVGDPDLSLSSGAFRHPLRPPIRWQMVRSLRQLCQRADVACYVTSESLQAKYPAGPDTTVCSVSDVSLRPEDFRDEPRVLDGALFHPNIVFAGTLDTMYKGVDILLEAIRFCIQGGLCPKVSLAGSGRHLPELQRQADVSGVADCVQFLGNVQGRPAMRALLDSNDLFVLPSRQEGLPRAMVEAMARGLPCIGTRVGGIPELLPDEVLIPANDPHALATTIRSVCLDRATLNRLSAENWARAHAFSEDALLPQRWKCYRELKARTSAWIEQQNAQTGRHISGRRIGQSAR